MLIQPGEGEFQLKACFTELLERIDHILFFLVVLEPGNMPGIRKAPGKCWDGWMVGWCVG